MFFKVTFSTLIVFISASNFEDNGNKFNSTKPCHKMKKRHALPPHLTDVDFPLQNRQARALNDIPPGTDYGDRGQARFRSRCDNGGRFFNFYCLSDADCRKQLGVNQVQNSQNVICIRALCCATTQNNQPGVNVATTKDEQYCRRRRSKGEFFMDVTCRRNRDCNNHDPGYNRRGYSIFLCVDNSYCCSKLHRPPARIGDPCINGGHFTGQQCNIDNDCVGKQNRERLICVDYSCCSSVRFRNYDDDDDDDNDDDYDDDDNYGSSIDDDSTYGDRYGNYNQGRCENDGRYLGSHCTTHEQCGTLLNRRWTAVCSGGRCCTNIQNLGENGRIVNTTDWNRGNNACTNYGNYIGAQCTKSTDCGSHPQLSYSCISGYCCELYDHGDYGDGRRDQQCRYRGAYLGYRCLYDQNINQRSRISSNGYCHQSRLSEYRNICIDDYCCSVLRRGRDHYRNERCTRNPFLIETGRRCAVDEDCFSYNRYGEESVVCEHHVCCRSILYDRRGGKYDDNGIHPLQSSENTAYCYDGTPSRRECNSVSHCENGESCVNHLCCPRTPDERQFVCGGIPTNSDCLPNGQCQSNLFCTASNLCCECIYGQPQIGVNDCRKEGPELRDDPFRRSYSSECRSGYYCNSGGFCCPRCPNGEQPFGSCYQGKCSSGYHCRPGNICCEGEFN